MPPAATTIAGCPVSGDLYLRATSTTAGMRMLFAISPVWPRDISFLCICVAVALLTTPFAALGTYNVYTSVQSLHRMLGVSNHVHDQDASLMQSLDSPRRRHANCTDKQLRSILDRDLDQVVELTVCVIVVGLARTAAHLRERKIDAKRE